MTRFIDTHREEFGVEPICTLLQAIIDGKQT